MERGCVGTFSEDILVSTQSLRSNWYNFCLAGFCFCFFFLWNSRITLEKFFLKRKQKIIHSSITINDYFLFLFLPFVSPTVNHFYIVIQCVPFHILLLPLSLYVLKLNVLKHFYSLKKSLHLNTAAVVRKCISACLLGWEVPYWATFPETQPQGLAGFPHLLASHSAQSIILLHMSILGSKQHTPFKHLTLSMLST